MPPQRGGCGGRRAFTVGFMSALRYDLASVALYDPVALNRNATRNVLYALGFRDIESYAVLDDMRRAIASRELDLLVVEATGPDDPSFDFVTRLRKGEVGRNPFAVVIVSTWIAESAVVRNALDAGADDLLCRPFSTSILGERIRTHAQVRKQFVVTSDYIGPDRRKDESRTNTVRAFDVVNSLKLKAVDGLSGFEALAATSEAVAKAQREINLERIRRLAFQAGVVSGFVLRQAGGEEEVRRADLEKVLSCAAELSVLAKTEALEQAYKTSQTVIDVAKTALEGEDIARNAQILVRLSVALQVTLSPELTENLAQSELQDTLDRIRARGRRA